MLRLGWPFREDLIFLLSLFVSRTLPSGTIWFLMSMTNLPQQARLSNLLAEEPEDRVEAIEEEPT